MGLLIDEVTLVVPGNLVKRNSPDGKNSLLRVTREQLPLLKAAIAEADEVFGNSDPTPYEQLTSDAPAVKSVPQTSTAEKSAVSA